MQETNRERNRAERKDAEREEKAKRMRETDDKQRDTIREGDRYI